MKRAPLAWRPHRLALEALLLVEILALPELGSGPS